MVPFFVFGLRDMVSITIKNIPDTLLARLREQAGQFATYGLGAGQFTDSFGVHLFFGEMLEAPYYSMVGNHLPSQFFQEEAAPMQLER